MDDILDISFNEMLDNIGALLSAFKRSYDRLIYIINISFPNCEKRELKDRFGHNRYVMTVGFHELIFGKLLVEYKIYAKLKNQLYMIKGIILLFKKNEIIQNDYYQFDEFMKDHWIEIKHYSYTVIRTNDRMHRFLHCHPKYICKVCEK